MTVNNVDYYFQDLSTERYSHAYHLDLVPDIEHDPDYEEDTAEELAAVFDQSIQTDKAYGRFPTDIARDLAHFRKRTNPEAPKVICWDYHGKRSCCRYTLLGWESLPHKWERKV